ncbi:MAG: DUF3226 domain-containing protein [Acidimicrobiales bacterium]
MSTLKWGDASAQRKVLFVEGDDEFRAIAALMQDQSISGLGLRDLHGRTNLGEKLSVARKASGFSEVQSVGILCDAEQSFAVSWSNVTGALEVAGLSVPAAPLSRARGTPDVTVFISPDNSGNGVFEDIFLDCMAGDPHMGCVEPFASCITGMVSMNAAHESKLKMQALVASKGKRLIGEAADNHVFDWSHIAFRPLIEFLRTL